MPMRCNEHTFVVCAYGESSYLKECLQFIIVEHKVKLIMVTSISNGLICGLVEKYLIKLYIYNGKKGITQDWNFTLRQMRTKYATIVHQVDVYERNYLESVLTRIKGSRSPLIALSDYFEVRDGQRGYKNIFQKC